MISCRFMHVWSLLRLLIVQTEGSMRPSPELRSPNGPFIPMILWQPVAWQAVAGYFKTSHLRILWLKIELALFLLVIAHQMMVTPGFSPNILLPHPAQKDPLYFCIQAEQVEVFTRLIVNSPFILQAGSATRLRRSEIHLTRLRPSWSPQKRALCLM